jgi:hypothetical protein
MVEPFFRDGGHRPNTFPNTLQPVRHWDNTARPEFKTVPPMVGVHPLPEKEGSACLAPQEAPSPANPKAHSS